MRDYAPPVNSSEFLVNNSTASDCFNLERGVRQGDPLSPYLFILAVETMAIAIRENVEIKGIKLGEEETKLLQYAGDTTAVLSDTNSALALFKLLESFQHLSGLKGNSSKTEGLWIRSLKYYQNLRHLTLLSRATKKVCLVKAG